jgi:hypothetical protein
MMRYICPICGYPELNRPPQDYTICPCCGVEFGYEDFTASHADLRAEWLASGARWFSKRVSPPHDWNAQRQLTAAGLADEADAGTPATV